MKKSRALIISLPALLLVVFAASGLVMRGYRHELANHDLILAIKANDTKRALDALHAEADPNVRDQSDKAPSLHAYLSTLWQQMRGFKIVPPHVDVAALGLAVLKNNTVIVEALLAKGAKNTGEPLPTRGFVLSVTGPSGPLSREVILPVPMLNVAVGDGNVAIVRALCRHGWNVNASDEDQQTVLFIADDEAMVKTLVACGAHVNFKDRTGRTALDYALLGGSLDLVTALLDQGADDANAVALAISLGNGTTSPLPGFRPIVRQIRRDIILFAAVHDNDVHSVLALLAEGADANLHSLRRDTPSVFGRWLAHRVHKPPFAGRPPNALMEAMAVGKKADDGSRKLANNDAIVAALVEHGADVNRFKYANDTPLRVAIGWYRPKIVRLLLAHGADPNQNDGETGTILYGELNQGLTAKISPHQRRARTEIIQMLRKAGAKE